MPKLFHLVVNEKAIVNFEKIKQYLTRLTNMVYILVTEHLGPDVHNYTKHYHIFVQYKYSKLLSAKYLYGAHNEECYSSAQKNIQYLKCEDDKHKKLGTTYKLIYEEGEPNFKGGYRTVGELRNWQNSQELPAIYYNIRKRIREDYELDMDVEDLEKEVEVYWIQGESGIGKTKKAKQIIREKKEKYGTKLNNVKYEKPFWLGVGTAPIALYDDFRDSHMKPSEFINFIDYNIHYMNIKNGSKLNRFKLIIITSVQKLEDIYLNVSDEPRKQWLRRLNVIDLY